MSEFYTVRRNTLVQVGNYTNVDEAEIVKVMTGGDAVVITQELNAEFEQGSLGCFENKGEFYIKNEKSERVCTVDVGVQTIRHDDSDWNDSTSSFYWQLSEEYYQWSINGIWSDKINLTDTLKREINNTIENFIFRINEENN